MAGIFKRIRQKFGISAPRMTVRTHLAWYWRWLGVIVVAAVSLVLAAWMYDAGRRFAGFDSSETREELTQLRSTVASVELELARLRTLADAADAKLKIEQSAQVQLVAQLKQYEQENVRLKEDLALFEGLVPNAQRDERVSIHRFTVQPGANPAEYRYRMLVLQGGKRDQAFQGRMQFMGDLQDKGRNAMIPLSGDGIGDNGVQPLNFKFFHRVEGTFRVQPAARIRTVQVKIFENGSAEARAAQTVNLP
jgi:hypothetical protein